MDTIDRIADDIGKFGLRVGAGLMMLLGHGWGKLNDFLASGDFATPLPVLGETAQLGLATFAEFLCSALLVVGLFTRAAAIPLIVTMAIAAFVVHYGDPWGDREMAVLYGLVFLSVMLVGPGKYSLDEVID